MPTLSSGPVDDTPHARLHRNSRPIPAKPVTRAVYVSSSEYHARRPHYDFRLGDGVLIMMGGTEKPARQHRLTICDHRGPPLGPYVRGAVGREYRLGRHLGLSARHRFHDDPHGDSSAECTAGSLGVMHDWDPTASVATAHRLKNQKDQKPSSTIWLMALARWPV